MELATLNLADALELATQTHSNGYLAEAEDLYGLILQAEPHHPLALQCLGLLLHQRGYGEQAVSLLQASVALAPTGEVHFSIGNILLQQGRIPEAITEFEDALILEPEKAEYWNILGETLQRQERQQDAASAFLNALALQPLYVDALCNLGNVRSLQGQTNEAIECYCQAIVADPQRNKSKTLLGIAYSALGRLEEAAEVYRQWLEDEPENSTAAHLLAACSGEAVPERASDNYVESTFDEFAPTFDEQLLVHLSYQVPALIEEVLVKALMPARPLRGLDAGCGTGLCGNSIRPYVSHLTGVDLSSKMLALAEQRGIYDALIKTEITDYLFGQAETFDLIVMADTLIYFGALEKVISAAYRALREGGIFILTVESADYISSSFHLNLHGRYSHHCDYVCATLVACGFAISLVSLNVLRTELGNPVEGIVITAIKSTLLPAGIAAPLLLNAFGFPLFFICAFAAYQCWSLAPLGSASPGVSIKSIVKIIAIESR